MFKSTPKDTFDDYFIHGIPRSYPELYKSIRKLKRTLEKIEFKNYKQQTRFHFLEENNVITKVSSLVGEPWKFSLIIPDDLTCMAMDVGEDEDNAMFRELAEETGISGSNIKVIKKSSSYYYYNLPYKLQKKFWGGKYLGQKQRWYLAEFVGDESSINVATEDPEFSHWKWIAHDEIINAIVAFKRSLYNISFILILVRPSNISVVTNQANITKFIIKSSWLDAEA